MKVKELIEILKGLNPEMEIRYDSYEFYGDFPINNVVETDSKSTLDEDGYVYYNIC